jgi:hypothetical protein
MCHNMPKQQETHSKGRVCGNFAAILERNKAVWQNLLICSVRNKGKRIASKEQSTPNVTGLA